MGLTYAEPPRSFERAGQKIRNPGRIEREGLATCLDTSLLVAAALEAIGLNPAVVFTRGHAFAGVWLTDRNFPSVAEPDITELRKAIAAREFAAFETTLLTTRPPTGFAHAVGDVRRRLSEDAEAEFETAIDIARARSAGVRPLASHTTPDGTGNTDEDNAEPPAMPPMPDFGLLPGELVDETPKTAEGRIERWQRKLLDLSLRNRLLNFRDTAQSVPFYCPDVPTIEDRLADGRAMRAISLNDEDPIGERDPELFRRETGKHIHDDFALEALDRGEVCVPLSKRDMRARLTSLYRKARSDMAEGGTNTLFLAAGFLRWKKTAKDTRAYRAPLVLQPVALRRRSAQSDFRLARYEDEPRINATLLQFLQRDFDIRVPGLEGDLPRDSSGIDLPRIFEIMRNAIRDVPGFEVTEELALSTFSFAKYLMWKDLVDRTDRLRGNRLVKHLIDNPDRVYEGGDGVVPRAEEIDRRYAPADLVTPLPADSSQLAAVAAVAESKDLVIIGPPGTGKSQTIANMIADCLSKGRSVLFVAEKSAALDVVHRRLRKFGLGDACLELHSNKADRRTVLAQLGAAWDRAARKGDEDWIDVTDRLRVHRDELNGYVAELHEKGSHGTSVFEAIGIVAGAPDRDGPPLALHFRTPDAHDAESFARLERTVEELARTWRAIGGSEGLGSIAKADWSHAWQSKVFADAAALGKAAADLLGKGHAFQRLLGLSPGNLSEDDAAGLTRFAASIARISQDDYTVAVDERLDEFKQKLGDLETSIATLRREENRLSSEYSEESIVGMPLARLESDWREANAKIWPLSFFAKRRVRKLMQGYAESGRAEPENDLRPLRKMATEIRAVHESPLKALPKFRDTQTDTGALRAYLDDATEFRSALAEFENVASDATALAAAIRPLLGKDGQNEVSAHAAVSLVDSAYGYDKRREAYRAISGGDPTSLDLQGQIDEMETVIRSGPRLSDWTKWVDVRERAARQGLQPLTAALEEERLCPESAVEAFRRAYMLWWLPLAIDQRARLRRFAHWEHEGRVAEFRKLDGIYQTLAAEQAIRAIAHDLPAREAVPRRSELGTLRHQLGLQRPSSPIRKLIGHMPETFTKLAPCVLMSPLSIAQYLPADHAHFDVVIFDEASQITTWDAIGAIARGRQSVIVGDPKQLPPTNFFGRTQTDDEDLEQYEKDLPSILDEASTAGLPTLRLNWHYRSRDETLIAFSNYHYYGGGLVTFPSPGTGVSAVVFHKIDGIYARGKGRTNEAEAKAITAMIVKRLGRALALSEDKRPTFGVITFNIQQQELILDLLDAERRKNPALEWFFEDSREEPVIVKNLENIQGDERDVMLFSITFGKDVAGKMTMSFGALNGDGGEKRLNVAVTRARSELHVFASITSGMIDLGRTKAMGVRHLKNFLDYAERGPEALPAADEGSLGPAESPFEDSVAEALRGRGWEVRTQIGVSGFRIDLGIVHPDRAGAWLAGVECDGATYHRSASARDRDRTREAVLRGLGWEIVRIWSTDWFNNSAGALDRIDAALCDLLEKSRAKAEEEAADEGTSGVELAGGEVERTERDTSPPSASESSNLAPDTTPATAPADSEAPLPEAGTPAMASTAHMGRSPRQPSPETHANEKEPLDPDRFFDSDYTPTLTALVEEIVRTKGPIREDILARTIARRHGWRRTGRRIRERVLRCAGTVDIRKEGGNHFLWAPDTHAASIPWRGRRGRAPREIARAEIHGLIDAHPHIRRAEDPAKELSVAMGLSLLTEDTRSYLEICLLHYAQERSGGE